MYVLVYNAFPINRVTAPEINKIDPIRILPMFGPIVQRSQKEVFHFLESA